MLFSSSLITAVCVQIICQAFKVVFYSLKSGRLSLGYFFTAGGMPSVHSASVTSLSVSLGLRYGFSSEFFSIAFVFSLIIIYDSIRLRGAVQFHSRILHRLIQYFPGEKDQRIPHMVGHSLIEVAAGVAVGALLAALFTLFLY